jgi:cytochrome c biogenesis protein CcmG, thiol:disulfide interchange protein DsbE
MGTDTPTRSRLPWPAVAAAFVLASLAALGVVLVMGGSDDGDATRPTDGALELLPQDQAVGAPLSVDVEWPDDGERPLAEELDGPTVVNFFASWCAPCIAEMPDFEAVHQELGGDVAFIGVAVSDRTADAARIVDQTGVTYPWARDGRGDVANAAGITQMPATMFIDADGEIVTVHSGALTASQLRDLIETHLGQPSADEG